MNEYLRIILHYSQFVISIMQQHLIFGYHELISDIPDACTDASPIPGIVDGLFNAILCNHDVFLGVSYTFSQWGIQSLYY